MDIKTLHMLLASGILIIALIIVTFYKTQLSNSPHILAHLEPDKQCDLQKSACTLKINQSDEIRLSILPRPIPMVKKLNIEVNTMGVQVNTVMVDFQGTSMNMGPNSVQLKNIKPGTFQGNGMLPVCVRDSMEWKASVYLETSQGIIIAPFIFTTSKSQ